MMNNKVIIIGGGASGMVAAIQAKKNGNDVTIFEANKKPGRKILVTGNGHCNLIIIVKRIILIILGILMI